MPPETFIGRGVSSGGAAKHDSDRCFKVIHSLTIDLVYI
jgi:hypothetical protein